MNHLGDTNKMVSATPRMDASAYDDGAIWETGCEIERELNAATSEIERLTAKVAQLYEGAEEQKHRIKRLEKELFECNAHRERLIVSAMEAWGRIDEQEGSR